MVWPGNLESLFAVQGTRLAILPHATKIVQTISDIRIFLSFKESQAWAKRVNRPRRYKYCLPGVRRKTLKQLGATILVDSRAQFLKSCTGFQAKQDFGLRLSLDELPHFAFAQAFVLIQACIVIIWMHLHREQITCKKELSQSRESAIGKAFTAELRAVAPASLGQVKSSERAVRKDGFIIGQPDLANALVFKALPLGIANADGTSPARCPLIWIEWSQAAPAPNFGFEDGRKLKRAIEPGHKRDEAAK